MTFDLGVSDGGHEEACVEGRSGLGESEEKSQRWEQEDETTEQQNGGSRESLEDGDAGGGPDAHSLSSVVTLRLEEGTEQG